MTMEKLKIRRASLAELPQLLEFEQRLIAAERPFAENLKDGRISYYDLEELIVDDGAEVLVAELDNQLIASGYAKIKPSKAYLKHSYFSYLGFMYVDPEYRGKGLNKRIIEALMEWSKRQGIYELSLEVYSENTQAIRAYEKAGFSKNLVEMRIELEES